MIENQKAFLQRNAGRSDCPSAVSKFLKGRTMTRMNWMTPRNLALAGGVALLAAGQWPSSSAVRAADFNAPVSQAAAIAPMSGANSVIRIGAYEGASTRRVDLSIGKSVIIDLPRDAKEVFVANPEIANAVVRSTRKIFLIGRANGATSVFVFDTDGNQIASLEINVGRDLGSLRETLRRSFPKANIDVKPAGDSIILTGNVNNAAEAQQATDIANAFVGASDGAFASSRGAVINSLNIGGKDQVMLRVTVVEVGRSVLKQFGINTSGGWSTPDAGSFGTAAVFPFTPTVQASGNSITGSISGSGFTARATLQAFERAGISRTLAEPTLVAVSGESATFTAGGEIPVPGSEDCNAAGVCMTSVSFKPFGVNLTFTPVVLSENRISLRVSTEVTELDYENSVSFNRINIPGMKVRKSQTSVELPSGATIMTAGLISSAMGHAVSGTPGLMNLPVLGALFRSRDYQRRETELMIMVTPYIAQPMEPAQVARPDDGFIDAFDPQAILLGRLNRLYGVVGSSDPGPGVKGRFGFIAD
jgi:pilus assembly protein CpaC